MCVLSGDAPIPADPAAGPAEILIKAITHKILFFLAQAVFAEAFFSPPNFH